MVSSTKIRQKTSMFTQTRLLIKECLQLWTKLASTIPNTSTEVESMFYDIIPPFPHYIQAAKLNDALNSFEKLTLNMIF
jgi:hypothetical protein